MSKLSGLILTGLVALCAAVTPLTPVKAASHVDLALTPATLPVKTGEVFDISIQARSETQEVVGADIFLDFDSTKLAVVDMDPAAAGIQITNGTSLTTAIHNLSSNTEGHIDYSAGSFAHYPSGLFTIAVIRFRALAAVPSTASVTFSTSYERPTLIVGDTQAADVTGTLTGGTYTIVSKTSPASSGGGGGGSTNNAIITGIPSTTPARITHNEEVTQTALSPVDVPIVTPPETKTTVEPEVPGSVPVSTMNPLPLTTSLASEQYSQIPAVKQPSLSPLVFIAVILGVIVITLMGVIVRLFIKRRASRSK